MKKKSGYVLADVCENCINWEAPESHAKTGMQRSRKGFCVLFLKETAWDHGQQCTAFDPWPDMKAKMQNDQARPTAAGGDGGAQKGL